MKFIASLLLVVAISIFPAHAATPQENAVGNAVKKNAIGPYPVLPVKVTSFGAAITGGALYVYGGHTGRAHSYSNTTQAKTLRRLDLANPRVWESLGDGPGLQGLAMVAHHGKLYRIGGFTAKNSEGEEHDLWSQASVSSFDPQTKHWTKIASLPEPRSSHDAAVLGDKIFVAGGWNMAGAAEAVWHKTAWVLDASVESPQWKALPTPPFQRRALALAAHKGKLYVIGGMQKMGGPTRRVAIFTPTTGKWSPGPPLIGPDGMTGFGASAFATGGRLYVSTIKGSLQRLTSDGSAWEIISHTPTARFFHRMLPIDAQRLLLVGGASMEVGKFDEIDVLPLPLSPKTKQ